jgi:hypothetical protein
MYCTFAVLYKVALQKHEQYNKCFAVVSKNGRTKETQGSARK